MGPKGAYKFKLALSDLQKIFTEFQQKDFDQFGPVLRDGCILLDRLETFDNLAYGVSDDLARGHYHLLKIHPLKYGHYTVGPQSFKRFLLPPRRKLWSAKTKDNAFTIEVPDIAEKKRVFWAMRSCDLAALQILDHIYLDNKFSDPSYRSARKNLMIISWTCSQPSANCFCTSMGGSPYPSSNFDLNITEIEQENTTYYLLETGSEKGNEFIKKFDLDRATQADLDMMDEVVSTAKKIIQKKMEPEAASILKNNQEHPHWDEVANRCLSCANCTMVCPTCFCTSTEDMTDITGNHTERWLRWDSCFNGDFSYIHGGKIRNSTKSRYRQWMSHKLSNWYDQFGSSGCVGCGRCITWCPVGIDITEEIRALNDQQVVRKRPEPELI